MKILLAVDGSKTSDAAVQAVAGRTWPAGSEVRIVSAVEPAVLPGYDTFGLSGQFYADLTRASMSRASDAVAKAAAAVKAAHPEGLPLETETLDGRASRAVLDEADRWGADLIVVGSHGYGEVARLLLGSVSHAIAMHATCSVEIVRTRA